MRWKKIIRIVCDIVFLVSMILTWVVDHYRWDVSHPQMVALYAATASGVIGGTWLTDGTSKTFKYVSTVLLVAVFVIVFFGKPS